jgi:hypothetical protein
MTVYFFFSIYIYNNLPPSGSLNFCIFLHSVYAATQYHLHEPETDVYHLILSPPCLPKPSYPYILK